MIDNETFRSRIGIFLSRKPRKVSDARNCGHTLSASGNFFIYKLLLSPNITSSTPLTPPHTPFSFLWLIYATLMLFIWPVSLAMTLSCNISPVPIGYLNINGPLAFLTNCSLFITPTVALSYIKLFCAMTFPFFLRNHFSFPTRKRFSSRFQHGVSVSILWIFAMNFFFITVVNPSLLNPGPNSLSVLYQNVQGLIPFSNLGSTHPLLDRNKISELQSSAIRHKPDIIALNETWLKKSISNNEVLPDSQYEVFRNDRSRRTHPEDPGNPNKYRANGGGVLLAVRSDLNATITRLPVSLGIEMLALKITLPNNESIIVCTCYRVGTLGKSNHDAIIKYLRSLLCKKNPPKIYLVGDFNLPHADWTSTSSHISLEQSFIDSFNDLALSQMISSPTHKSGNILDILLSNHDSSIHNIEVCDPNLLCKSDHFPISFSIKTSFSRKECAKRKDYNFKKANWAMINQELCRVN